MTRLAAIALMLAPALASARPAEVVTSTREVRACLRLPDGGALAATAGGLVALAADGSQRVWTGLDGLPGTALWALAPAQGGAVWVGGETGLGRVRVGARGLTVEQRMAGAPVRAVLEAGGEVWAATWGGGVARLRGGALEAVPVAGAPSPERARVTALAWHDGALWAGTAGAGLEVLGQAGLAPADVALPSPYVWALASARGVLWAGTLAGLAHVGGETLGQSDVRALAVIDGALVAGSYGDGTLVLEGRRLTPRGPAAAAFVTALAPGCTGTTEGLFVGDRAPAASGLPSNDIAALAAGGGRVVIGTFDRGLAVLEAGKVRTIEAAALDGRINAVALEGRRIWVATARGLTVIDRGRVRRLGVGDGLPADDVHAITTLRGGGVLVGTTAGAAIVRLRGDRASIDAITTKQGIWLDTVWAVAEDPTGRLWLGTSRGLYRVRLGARLRWRRLAAASGHLPDDWITALAMDGDTLYAGTYAHGVVRIRVAGQDFTSEALGGGMVNLGGISAAAGRVYVATMDGLRVLLPGAAALADVEDAAPGRDVTAVAPSADGGLWVASRRGLARLVPSFSEAAPAAQR